MKNENDPHMAGRGGNGSVFAGQKNSTTPATCKPIIDLRAGELPRVVSEAIAALRAAGVPIYDRGGVLYRPIRIEQHDFTTGGVRHSPGSISLRPVDSTWLRVRLAEVAEWRRWDARAKDRKPTDPPRDIATIIVDTPDDERWPHLRAVVAHPVITPDGRVIAKPGYDQDARLLVDIDGDWPITEAPTRDDAIAACGRLRDLLRFYPWASDTDRAVALSLLITAIARPVLPAAPLHGVDAPEPGSGKSLLVDVAAILETGTPAAVMDYGDDSAEAAKRLDGMLLAGDSLIAIDNIERPLEGAAFCSTLTQSTRRVRPLGRSEVVTVPCTAMLAATGCNLTLRGDIVRRAIVCRLDARTERPELRDIDQDLLTEVREHRRNLVADAIAIMRAYAIAGHPDTGVSAIGSYAEWSRMVRSALVWAGEADPVSAMERTRGADPSRQAIHAVLTAWFRAYGREAVTAAEVVAHSERDSDLREALAMVAERGGRIQSKTLGYWMRKHKDRRAGVLVLRQAPGQSHGGVSRWIVESGSQDSGGDGCNGGDVTTLREEVSVTNYKKRVNGSPPLPPSPPLPDDVELF